MSGGFFQCWRKDKESKEKLLATIDVIQDLYDELIKDYAELKSQVSVLQHRKAQIQKQVDNLMVLIREETHEDTDRQADLGDVERRH